MSDQGQEQEQEQEQGRSQERRGQNRDRDQSASRATEDVPPPDAPAQQPRTPVPEVSVSQAATPPNGQQSSQIAELDDKWRRAVADLDNLRKRHARDLPRELAAERAKVAAAWLPVVDNLELALTHAGADPGAIVQGVQAIRDQAVEVLRSLGYPRHDEVGVPFDPALHDVVAVVEEDAAPDAAPGTVVEVLRPGYGDPGRQLRPAAVAVSRKQE
jgi:molecular chaperone GrpE